MKDEIGPGAPGTERRSRKLRLLGIGLAAAIFSLTIMTTAVSGEYDLGPGKVKVDLVPQLSGGTEISVPPFGSIRAATHRAPVKVKLSPSSVDTHVAQELVQSRPTQSDLVESLRTDLVDAFKSYALLVLLGGLVAGLLTAALLRTRGPAELFTALTVGVLVPAGLYVSAFAGFNPDAFRQPTLTGALSRSPELLGPVRQFGERFNALRGELDEIGSITFQLYQFLAQQSPIPEDAVRILHISDLHLNPVGFDVAQLVAERFNVQAVIDSGDATAEGSPLEVSFLDRIPGFGIPYIFIRGNHDSMVTQDAIGAKSNARVLDGGSTELEGLTIFGVGDPLFTPDKTVEQPSNDEQQAAKRAFARTVQEQLEALGRVPDIVVVHDSLAALRLHGEVPLVIHGHGHKWSAAQRDGTLILGVGSTGGAGLKSLAPDSRSAIELQVLYLDRNDHTLLGYDRIEVRGPEQQFLLKRTIVAPKASEPNDDPPATESASPVPSP